MRGSADWVATFLECRTRDFPVENLSPRNNTVATALSGCVTPGNVRVRARLSLSSVFFLRAPALRASLRERGRVRIIMALRVLTLHLLSRLVIHISPHVPSPCRVLFFSPRIRPSRMYPTSWFGGLCSIYRPSDEGIANIPSKNWVRDNAIE